MSDKGTDHAKEIATMALHLKGDERTRALDTACGGDEQIRNTVEILLSEADERTIRIDHDKSEEAAVKPDSRTEVEPERIPETIGPYKVISLIGSGGMGRVYRAEQSEPVRRDVAVKVLLTSILDRDQEVRFQAERQAMAHLTHPNIAQLYDAGDLVDGHPYFAMEYVEGQPLTTYADDKKLSIPERLKIFLAVCEGVSYAHLKGILHRDLKPDNILVADYGDQPEPKIIDFGIAKAIDVSLTKEDVNTGVVALGTLPYMGPEALEHTDGVIDLDFRSDVYALGVILYELLSGRRPYEQGRKALPSFVAEIISGGAPPPSRSLKTTARIDLSNLALRRKLDVAALHRRLGGDLDWIVMKAMDPDRERRYGSVAELTADIQRYLEFKPVAARPPSTTYKIRKFARRNRIATGFGVLAVVALLVGVASTVFGMLKAREAEANAIQQAEIAEKGRLAAEEATNFVLNLFLDADPYQAQSQTGGGELTARQLLDLSAERLLDSGLADQPEMRIRLMGALADVYLKTGLTDRAERLLMSAQQIRERSTAGEDLGLVDLLTGLAFLAEVQSDYPLAERYHRDAYRIAREHLGDDHQIVTRIRTDLAKVLLTQGDSERAEPILRAAMESTRRTVGVQHDDFVNAINALAFAHFEQGEYDEAESYFRETLRLAYPDQKSNDPNVAKSQSNLALVLSRQGKIEEAEATIRLAIANFGGSLTEGHWRYANAQTVLAACYLARGEFETAENLLLKYYPRVVEARGESSPYAQEIRGQLVLLYESWEKPKEAEPFRDRIEL